MNEIHETNDQYHIPSKDNSMAGNFDMPMKPLMPKNAFDTSTLPENEPTTFELIKRIEAYIHDSRDTALALSEHSASSRRAWEKVLRITSEASKPKTLHELIELESHRGGRLFGEGHRFWLDAKNQNTHTHKIGDWYHAQPDFNNPAQPIVLRFQTTPTSIHKLFGGIEYPLTQADMDNLMQAIAAYVHAVSDLYPLDSTITALRAEIDNKAAASRDDFDLAA